MPDLNATAFRFTDDLVPAAYKLPRPCDSGDECGQGRQDGLSTGIHLPTRPQARSLQTAIGDEYSGQGRQDSLTTGIHLPTRPQARVLQPGSRRDDPIEVHHSDSEDAAACGTSDTERSLGQPSTPTTLSRESGDNSDGFLSDAESYASDSTDDSDEVEPPSPEDLQQLREEIQSRDETIMFLLAYVARMEGRSLASGASTPPLSPRTPDVNPLALAGEEGLLGSRSPRDYDRLQLPQHTVARPAPSRRCTQPQPNSGSSELSYGSETEPQRSRPEWEW